MCDFDGAGGVKMTDAVKILTLIDIIFLFFVAISGSIGGLAGDMVYYLFAFTLPIAIGFYSSIKLRYKREEMAGVAESPDGFLSLDSQRAVRLIPLIAPLVAVVFTVSLLTSILLSALGAPAQQVEDMGILQMLLVYALVPAVFEEALFRYIPMKLLSPYSRRTCVFYSALCFALIHCSFWQMPYAFVAGVLFMIVDLALGSVWPSLILHFVNNAASVLMMKYCDTATATAIFVAVLFALALISSVFIYRSRKEYSDMLLSSLEKGG